MKTKKWLLGWGLIVGVILVIVGITVFRIDPVFHYRKPNTNKYFYKLDNQRNQNDGIIKHFDYDAVITGTSMAENFKTSEFDELFGTHSIKVPISGATFREVNDEVKKALESNKNIKIVVRSLEKWRFNDDPNGLREDLGEYPEYLYDDNPFNDVKYLFNKNVFFGRVIPMIVGRIQGKTPGITSFDDYSRWQELNTFGRKTVIPKGAEDVELGDVRTLSEYDRNRVLENTIKNVTSIADEYPDVGFYYFFTPYSAMWYKTQKELGYIYEHIEAERILIEEILKHDNIKLFIFTDLPEIVSDLNNYKDDEHYASWINSYILTSMKKGEHLVTKTNYEYYLDQEFEYCKHLKFSMLNDQVDYEDDNYQAALWNQKIWGVLPINLIKNNSNIVLKGFEETEEGLKVNENKAKISIDANNIGKHNYLVITYKNLTGDSTGKIVVTSNNKAIEEDLKNNDTINTYRQQVIDLNYITDDINLTVDINGDSEITISNIVLY